jgi:hypothetical protein
MAGKKSAGAGRYVLSAAVAVLLGTTAFVAPQWTDGFVPAAWAQEGSGEGKGGQGGEGQGGQGGQGGEGGQGQGGPGVDSEGKGPKAGSGGSEGGKPVWADSFIDTVELGRLNVARSPDSVLNRAYDEALATLTDEMIAFYNLSTADMIETLTFDFDNAAYIDSPLQNLALLKDALDGTSALTSTGVNTDVNTLMAIFLAVASDKEGDGPTALIVEAVTTILGSPVTGDAAEALADEAHDIWVAVVAGHG